LDSEICLSPGFGTERTFPFGRTGDYKNCAGAPSPSTSPQIELFWIPTRLGRNCRTTGDLSATLSNRQIRIVNLINLDGTRRLTFTGTGQGDVLVGSPGTSDRLIGGGGNDTYVVGGNEASLVVGPGDTIFPVSAVTEADRITLGASAENIYINPGPAGQSNPGPLDTPIPPPPASRPGTKVSFTPRGASAVAPAKVPAAGVCRAFIPEPRRLPWAASFPLLASLPDTEGSRTDSVAPLLLEQSTTRSPEASMGSAECRLAICGGEGQGTPNARLDRDAFPGAPSLVGFSLNPARADRLFLPAKDFTFQGRPINDYLSNQKSLKVLIVNRAIFAPPQVVSPTRLRLLQATSRGLANVRSDEAPLIYFRPNGLLVFSRNGEPLGSPANPGRIIAQLLDESGRPLPLPTSGAQRFYKATFLEFLPAPSPRTDPPAGRP
jgi:hypothetical protein